jgi:hypothetical protein
MIKFVWDIDGVLRNLYPIVRRKFNLWSPDTYEAWDEKGYNIYELAKKDNYRFLLEAKPTKYFEIIKRFSYCQNRPTEVWSWQPEDWRPHTIKWLKRHLKEYKTVWLRPEEKYDRLKQEKNTVLVDDYPLHICYDNILLIDQKYNKKVNCKDRIKTVKDLRRKLWHEI